MPFLEKHYLQCRLVKVNVNLSLHLTKTHTTEAYKVVEVQFHTFLTSAMDGGEDLSSCPTCLMP